MKGRIALLATIILLLGAFLIPQMNEGIPSRSITGRQEISSGLLSSASFTAVEVFDHDGDGKDEIYLGGAGRTNPRTQGIRAYEYNPASNSWSAYGSGLPGSSSGDYYGALGVGDVNKDGNMDIVAPSQTKWYSTSTNKVEIFTSTSGGAFSLSHTFSPGKSTSEAEIADLDGDSSMDIVYTYDGGVTVQFGSGSATSWTEKSPSSSGREMDGVGVGDLNDDGLLDLVSTAYSGSNVYFYIQGSSRTWSSFTKSIGSVAFGAKIADMNGDGNNDTVIGSRSDGIRVWCGNGGGSTGGTSFSWTDNSSGLPSTNGDWSQVELGDVDDDGDLDIIASRNNENRTRIYINNLPSSWTQLFSSSPLYLGSGADAYGANFGDWDGDGDLDAVACSWGGGADAWLITRTVTPPPPPENQKPMPFAGADIEIMLGETVTLDGRNSTDPEDAPEGDEEGILTYQWNFTSVPAQSSVNDDSLSPNDTVARPSFTPDRPGLYDLTLAVFDGEDWSNESDEDDIRIRVIKPNDPPVAVTGKDLSGYVGETYILDGTGSYDVDGEVTGYDWTCTSHTVTLVDTTTSTPEFTPSEATTFEFTLRVMDDNMTWSENIATINVTTVEVGENILPIAHPGSYPSVLRGETVSLDGSNSTDPDGIIISWEWSSTSHTITFQGQNTTAPSFVAMETGIYVISLRVEDSNHTWSQPESTEIISEEPYFNDRPVADAGEDLEAFVGDLVELDGSGSSDPNGNIVQYNWTCTSHQVQLSERLTARPSFVPRSADIYIFTLSVSDNEGAWSPEDEIRVTVSEIPIEPVDIKVGPFLYDDNTPIVPGQVRLTPEEGSPLLGVVISDGTSSFIDVMPGNYSVEFLDGSEVIIGPLSVEVTADGNVEYLDGPIPKVEKDEPGPDDDDDQPVDDDDDTPIDDDDETEENGEETSLLIKVLAVGIVLVVAGGVVAFIILTRNKNDDPEGEDHEDNCPECGREMEFKSDFEKYYCKNCGRYR